MRKIPNTNEYILRTDPKTVKPPNSHLLAGHTQNHIDSRNQKNSKFVTYSPEAKDICL